MQARKQQVHIDAFGRLSKAEQELILCMRVMQHLGKSESRGGALCLQGDRQLVSQVNYHIFPGYVW